ncbi:MAG TPA: transcription initiation protein [Mycobacteriales bacterium]|nr:transcription initiation protein [Mycobacteriales bacterium]
MTRYLITFPSNAMDHIPDEEMPEVARAAHACCQELIDAGVYVVAGGLRDQAASVVATDGSVTDGPMPNAVSGITIVDVPSREDALRWAAKIAVACRCAQEVREITDDVELDAMLRDAAR